MSGSPYTLVELQNGLRSIRANGPGETFHPVVGPEAEAETLYVRQLDLARRAAAAVATGPFVIWDIGLGGAANALGAIRATREVAGPLHLVSFDWTLEPLRFAVAHATPLGYLREYRSLCESLAHSPQGLIHLVEGPRSVCWETRIGDFPAALSSAGAETWPKPHAILYDAFSPATNADMWTLPVFARIHALLAPDRPCALATYSRSTLLRVTLLVAGFYVGTGQPTGEKEETTVAANTPELIGRPLGREWLSRARRSSSAEPLREPRYSQSRLTAATWDRLLAHPQFR